MLLNESSLVLNEVFSMDSFNKKQLESMAEEIILNLKNNDYIYSSNEGYDIWLPDNYIPQEVLDMIYYDLKSDPEYNWLSKEDTIPAYEVLSSKYAKKYVMKFIMNEFQNTYKRLESLGNPLTLYRFINLELYDYKKRPNDGLYHEPKFISGYDDTLNHILSRPNIHLGICWTPSIRSADEFGSESYSLGNGIILEAKVSRDAINLRNTLIKRNSLTYFSYENEIELIKGSKIMLTRYYQYDDDGDMRPHNVNKPYRV